jgi:hypothetical protein
MAAIIHHPPTIINKYLASKIDPNFELDMDSLTLSDPPLQGTRTVGTTYFFPTLPTDIENLTTTFPQSNEVFAVYDRMFKMRRTPFPYIKCEQLLYYFYAVGENATAKMVITQQQISDLLDRGDDSAKDLNEWAASNQGAWEDESKQCFFHNFKIYQLEETRDIIDFGTARTYAGNKIIIDYDWHPVWPDSLNP